MSKRFKIQPHNYGTEEAPVYTDFQDIIDTHNGNIVYTEHSTMCGHLIEEINNPSNHNIEDVDKYLESIYEARG